MISFTGLAPRNVSREIVWGWKTLLFPILFWRLSSSSSSFASNDNSLATTTLQTNHCLSTFLCYKNLHIQSVSVIWIEPWLNKWLWFISSHFWSLLKWAEAEVKIGSGLKSNRKMKLCLFKFLKHNVSSIVMFFLNSLVFLFNILYYLHNVVCLKIWIKRPYSVDILNTLPWCKGK